MKTPRRCNSWGAIERTAMEDDHLRLAGWVISMDSASVVGAGLQLGDADHSRFDLCLGSPTPHLATLCWSFPSAERAGFHLRLPLSTRERASARDRLVVLVPHLADGREGDPMVSVVEPSLEVPSDDMVEGIGGGFQGVSFEFLGHLIAKLGLEPSDHLLDIGCGLGRIAYGLCHYLEESARYEGFDVSEPPIEWANRTIAARHPNFRFQRLDLQNAWYNPRGRLGVEDFQFPYPDQSFDAVVSTSVFTHMRSVQVGHYLDEIHRVLRSGGRCLVTFFLINAEARLLIESGRSSQRFSHRIDDFFTIDPKNPEGAIGFDEETLWNWLEARGLTPGSTFYGTWCGRSGPGSYQDLLVLEKTTRRSGRAVAKPQATQLVPCAAGGNVVLDAPLFRLLNHARTETTEAALRSWSAEENQDPEIAGWALTALERAGLLPGPGSTTAIPSPLKAFSEGRKVSIIILSCDGRRHLERLLPSIAQQTYPEIETIVVDNGSRNEPVSWLREAFPWVEVIPLSEDAGFSGASNLGAAKASGDLLFFLNNDTWLEATAVERLVARLEGEEGVGAVVPLVRLMEQPAFVNTLGNQIQSKGWARDGYIGHLDLGQLSAVRRVPSASFGAVLVPRTAYQTVGPLDESYGYYYEDMDWSWRARGSGLQILAEPRALVFHAGSATSVTRPPTYKLRFVARNRLRFAAKNLPAVRAVRFALTYLWEDLTAAYLALGKRDLETVRAYRIAWVEFFRMIPGILRFRKRAKKRPLVRGERLLAEMEEYPYPRQTHDGPVLALPHVIADYGPHLAESGRLSRTPDRKRLRVLVASRDAVRLEFSGPGTRYWELARVLSRDLNVTFLAPAESEVTSEGMEVALYRPGDAHRVQKQLERSDLALVPIDLLHQFPSMRAGKKPLAIDLQAPSLLECGDRHEESPVAYREVIHARRLEAYQGLLHRGDFFLCASERQRDFWLGMLLAAGRLGPLGQARDETFRHLIDVVPFGISPEASAAGAAVLRGVVPGWLRTDKVILWMEENGQDWRTPIEAMSRVVAREPRARLHVLGGESEGMRDAEKKARDDDLLDTHVFFHRATFTRSSQASFLAEADVGLVAQRESPQTMLSVRTLPLDCIGAGLPMVVTPGDGIAERVRDQDLGRVVPAGDVERMAEALLDLIARPDAKTSRSENFEGARRELSWEVAAGPLVRFALSPHSAFDRAARDGLGFVLAEAAATPVNRLPARALQLLRKKGLFAVLKRTARHMKWRLSRQA